MNLHNIPQELKDLPQWVAASADKIPVNPRTGRHASPTDPETWGTFEEACQCSLQHVGFVLSKSDPYAIIDLDKPENEEQAARHRSILASFRSYAETSQSGNGVHIIVRGSVPKGVRRDKVEVYSEARYMICTGYALNASPITEQQELLNQLYAGMAPVESVNAEPQEQPETITDEQIWQMATTAANADKFVRLWQGDLSGYPSQSEADFALLSMLAFYSKNDEQVRRLFRFSELGKRPKASKDRYLNRAITHFRSKEPQTVDISKLKPTNYEQTTDQTRQDRTPGTDESLPEAGTEADVEGIREIRDAAPVHHAKKQGAAPVPYPPGFIGRLAEYFFASSVRPVHEIALVASLGLTAGVCGRSYNVSGMGLSQYLVLIAPTGSGKEGIGSGIDRMISAVRARCPAASNFVGPGAFASGQALVRVLDKQPCFVSILGEFGLMLKQLSDPRANGATVNLKKVILDLYAKSGFNSFLQPSVYSDHAKNTNTIQSPNVTILGESTPESFFSTLESGDVASGLIPRFLMFEATGPRPDRNRKAFIPPPDELVNEFAGLMAVALATNTNHTFCPVSLDADGERILDALDDKATAEINTSGSEVSKQLWNRAHLKALKLAALVAVGCNPHRPVIDRVCAEWASLVVTQDVERMLAKFSDGDIGNGDSKREFDAKRAIQDYLEMPRRQRMGYAINRALVDLPVIPYAFLIRRLRPLASFKNDRRGENAAVRATLDSMVESGILDRVNPVEVRNTYGIRAPIFTLGDAWKG